MFSDLPFLAEFTPFDSAFQVNIYSLIALLAALGGLWALVRRKPPLDTQISKLETAIDSLQTSVDGLTAEQKNHSAHEAKIQELQTKVRLLENHRETDAHAQRGYIQKSTQEIFVRIESHVRTTNDQLTALTAKTHAEILDITATFAENVQRIERAVGQIEGAQSAMRDQINRGT